MNILFHSATTNKNTDLYIFTLILKRGLPFPVGVSETHTGSFPELKNPPEVVEVEEGQEITNRCYPFEQTAKPLSVQHFTMLFTRALPSTHTDSLSSSFHQSMAEEGKRGMY